MPHARRDFIKFVVAGSVVAGCPVDLALLAQTEKPGARVLEDEHFGVCHQLRDGHHFELPQVSKKVDVAIIGGGVAGLSAAYFLREKDFLLLEKEEHFGGNAYQEEYDGQP